MGQLYHRLSNWASRSTFSETGRSIPLPGSSLSMPRPFLVQPHTIYCALWLLIPYMSYPPLDKFRESRYHPFATHCSLLDKQ